MSSHLSSIGFPVASHEELVALARRITDDAVRVSTPRGDYVRYRGEGGEELWLQLDHDGDLVGLTPHFAGKSRVRVALTDRLSRRSDSALDGAFHGWADPATDDPRSGCYPFVFDCPDAASRPALALPALVDVQLVAFAHEIEVFDSVEEYDARQDVETEEDEQPVSFASQSFVPASLFGDEERPADTPQDEPPPAYAFFSGHVIEARRVKNALTGGEYHWILVETYGATIDVVVDRSLLETEPRPGGVVSGSFWLSGRILEVHGRSS
jgi:hypothetical protein